MGKKIWKITAAVAALALIVGLGCFANAMVGNPLSRHLATRTAQRHLVETYPGTDYLIDRVGYSFKDGYYHAFITSPSSADTYFSIAISMTGALRYDTFDAVENGSNTARRLDQSYRELADTVLESPSFPYQGSILYGTLEIHQQIFLDDPETYYDIPAYSIVQDDLVLDQAYDIRQLGARAGHLTLYVESDVITSERAAEILTDIDRLMEEGGVPYFAVDFHLVHPRSDEGIRPDERISVENFLREDIQGEDLPERLQTASEALAAHWAEVDKQLKDEEQRITGS